MKIASAWFLLLLSLSNWVGGYLCFQVSYAIEARRQMNATERQIAEELKQEAGIESMVLMSEKAEMTPRGNFYGDFVFSKEINSSTVYFTIEYPPKTVSYEKIATQHHQAPVQSDGKMALLKSLFNEFMIPVPALPETSGENRLATSFHVAGCHSFSFLLILSPPPDFV